MNALKPKTAMSNLIRRAYTIRYDLRKVVINKNGNITGLVDSNRIRFGNVATHSWVRTPSMNIQLRSGENVVYTFSSDN